VGVTTRKLVNTVTTVILVLLASVFVWKIEMLLRSDAEPVDQLTSITALDLKEALDQQQQIVVLDVRPRAEYAAGHIPTAKNIPYDEIEMRAPNELGQDDRIVTYCRCQDDTRSDMARQVLTSLGFKSAVFLKGGIQNWEEQHYATSRSESHISAARLCTKSLISLCNLCVLCVSVVVFARHL